jgi:hypothetical protein
MVTGGGSTFVEDLRAHVKLCRRLGQQIFLLGPKGVPFHAAVRPVRLYELELLRLALDDLAALEQEQRLPFLVHDPAGRYSVAAVEQPRRGYIVILAPGAEALACAVRVEPLRPSRWGAAAIAELWIRS